MMYLIHFVNKDDVDITDIKKFYKKTAKKINDLFRKHFTFKKDDFKVGWKRYADDSEEDEHDAFKTEIFDVVKSAMTFMDLDFKSIDLRKQFLTDYLLMDEVEEEAEPFIAEMEAEQLQNETQNVNHKNPVTPM